MKTALLYLSVCIVSYLLGSINASIILSKLLYKKDIRNYGSGNGGLTNSYRTMGGKVTLIVLLVDFAKGCAACAFGGWLFGLTGTLLAGVFALLGHVFPVFFGFKGGKGVLTGAALALMVDWRVFAIVIGIFIVLVICTRLVSLSSVTATSAFAVVMPLLCPERTVFDIILGIACVLIIDIKHHSNIKRLLAGKEPKFSFRKDEKSRITKN